MLKITILSLLTVKRTLYCFVNLNFNITYYKTYQDVGTTVVILPV